MRLRSAIQEPGSTGVQNMIIGIDLGTTNSLVGIWQDGKSTLIPNALGLLLTPSAISVDDRGAILVGQAARDRLVSEPKASIAAFKRYMGTNREFRLGTRAFRAEELSALVLRQLKADAETFLGHPVTEAVITVPAYFNDAQRKATKAAGELAGLKVERLLNEPTAAALAYGLQEHEGERKILVLDLGGGTFDVSILEMFEGVMEVRATAGDNFLGGEDFVDAIMDRFIAAVGDRAKIPPRSQPSAVHGALRRAAEVAKRALSESEHHEMAVVVDGWSLGWTLTRDEFELLSDPLIKRIRAPIERALRDAKLHPDQITHLVLAGGATRMPLFKRLAARLFQRLPIAQINPDEVIAHGAAVQAGLKMRDHALDDVVMTDVAPFSMGIEVAHAENGRVIDTGLYMPIIERNTVIPTSRSHLVSTCVDNQARLRVTVFQGEARLVRDNVRLGELMIPIPRGPAGSQPIDIRFTYDVSGLLEVEICVVNTGGTDRLVIEGHPGVLTPPEIAERLAKLRHLKIHPRDQAENQAVMARAERLYEERLGDERLALAEVIDRFRLIIERQDPGEIDAHREKLSRWLDSIDRSFFT
jgi:molecular chaperone HscC